MAGFDLSELNLPFNMDAEQAVLGSMLVDPTTVSDVTAKLKSPEHFKVQLHQGLYSVIYQMNISGEQIDIVTVIEAAVRQGIFENNDEAKAYLLKLADLAINPSSIERYIEIISDKYMVRQLMTVSNEIYELAVSGTEETPALLDFAEKKIYEIRQEKDHGMTLIGTLVAKQLDELAELKDNPDSANGGGLSTSYKGLDNLIFGLNPSDLILIAARPGMGKTSFATNIAANVGKRYPDRAICIFSLEMSKEQIAARVLQSEARISSDQMRTGAIRDNQWKDIAEAVDVLSQVKIYIDDTANIPISEMKAKLRRTKNLGLVVIDYLQLMSTGRRDGNRVAEVSEITRNLKIMAKELNVPVIALSQLSRSPEQRPDKRPLLSDLRDSGSIEQDADIVMFLYRDGYYNKEAQYPNACECIVAKNRHGSTGTVPMNWDGQFTRFTGVDFSHGQ